MWQSASASVSARAAYRARGGCSGGTVSAWEGDEARALVTPRVCWIWVWRVSGFRDVRPCVRAGFGLMRDRG